LKYLIFLSLVTIISCTAPKTALPNISSEEQVQEVNFSKIRIQLKSRPPSYPQEAREKRIEGMVVLRCTIDRSGIPTRVEVISGPEEFRKVAEQWLLEWRFFPTIIDGKPEKVKFIITMPFKLG
jgi:TonB family protein